VADYDADPNSLSTDPNHGPGAIFAVDLITGNTTTVMSDARLLSPVGVTVDYLSGDLWIVDADAPVNSSNNGSIWRYYISKNNLVFITSFTQFVSPFKIKPDGTGDLILSDSGDYANDSPGKMFTINPNLVPATVTELKSGDPLESPSGFIIIPGTTGNSYLITDRDAGTSERKGILQLDSDLNLSFIYISDLFVTPMDIVASPY
jgi:hypothetical protein